MNILLWVLQPLAALLYGRHDLPTCAIRIRRALAPRNGLAAREFTNLNLIRLISSL
jgi:hypothetical protein